jgi:hypothetical protein
MLLLDRKAVHVLARTLLNAHAQFFPVSLRRWRAPFRGSSVLFSERLRVELTCQIIRPTTTTPVPKYLFANAKEQSYTKSGCGSPWSHAMFNWIASFDKQVAASLAAKRE